MLGKLLKWFDFVVCDKFCVAASFFCVLFGGGVSFREVFPRVFRGCGCQRLFNNWLNGVNDFVANQRVEILIGGLRVLQRLSQFAGGIFVLVQLHGLGFKFGDFDQFGCLASQFGFTFFLSRAFNCFELGGFFFKTAGVFDAASSFSSLGLLKKSLFFLEAS